MRQLTRVITSIWPHIFNDRLCYYSSIIYSVWKSKLFAKTRGNFTTNIPLQLKGGQYIEIGANFSSGYRNRIECWDRYGEQMFNPKIVIGDNFAMNNDCHIGAISKISIGNNVLLASRVFITDHSHGDIHSALDNSKAPAQRDLFSKGEVVIEDNVWIGEGVVIMPGVIIGRNSIIGANSVVTKNVEPYSIAAGVPAKQIKKIE